MDIVAHTLWAAAGAAAMQRHRPLSRPTVIAALVLAALPDVLHMLPVVGWWLFSDGSFAALRAYAVAIPGQEPGLPPLVQLWSHDLHCVMHSAPIAALVAGAVWAAWRTFWISLLGWWSHIVIDVFTHSADYYAVPVLYPFTERGFDGIAWTTPWFMALNYVALVSVGLWLVHSRPSRPTVGDYPFHHRSDADVAVAPWRLFDWLDDPRRLASHMEKPSLMTAGSSMHFETDTGLGRTIGSHIRMSGRVLGVHVALDEVVTLREPPLRKTWETVGEPRLLVIGAYRMGFVVSSAPNASHLVVFIDYRLPAHGLARVLGRLLGRWYAGWCTRRMAYDAQHAATAAPESTRLT